jgi:hypothetical protein
LGDARSTASCGAASAAELDVDLDAELDAEGRATICTLSVIDGGGDGDDGAGILGGAAVAVEPRRISGVMAAFAVSAMRSVAEAACDFVAADSLSARIRLTESPSREARLRIGSLSYGTRIDAAQLGHRAVCPTL